MYFKGPGNLSGLFVGTPQGEDQERGFFLFCFCFVFVSSESCLPIPFSKIVCQLKKMLGGLPGLVRVGANCHVCLYREVRRPSTKEEVIK